MKFAYLIEPPFNYREPDGTVTGSDVELARHVLGELDHSFEPVEAEFAELLPGLASGRWQMTTGLFATDERKKTAAFSHPIWALSDGLLVPKGNPGGLTGYASAAQSTGCKLAVIRDQIQHRAAVEFGMPDDQIVILDTYDQAASAVLDGTADAYASVARAHMGYLAQNPKLPLDVVTVPSIEKARAFGCFGFSLTDRDLLDAVDRVLYAFIGTGEHRVLMSRFGFTDTEIDLLTN